jgi:hypothetical protein
MTTVEDRPCTALVVLDVQDAVVAGAHPRVATAGRIRTAGAVVAEPVAFR